MDTEDFIIKPTKGLSKITRSVWPIAAPGTVFIRTAIPIKNKLVAQTEDGIIHILPLTQADNDKQ